MQYDLSGKSQFFLKLYQEFRKSRYFSFAKFLFDTENQLLKICDNCDKIVPYTSEWKKVDKNNKEYTDKELCKQCYHGRTTWLNKRKKGIKRV